MTRRGILIFLIALPPLFGTFYLFYNLQVHLLLPSLADASMRKQIVYGLSNILTGKYETGLRDHGSLETESSRTPFVRHTVAVGDLHGDLANARKVLHFSGVADEFGNWTGNVDVFAQTGDIIDRGDHTVALFTWMDRLRSQAQDVGGIVLSHLGNHEWMNALGDWRYVYPSELKTFGTVAARQKMISTGRIGRSWARNYTTASRLPLHPSMGPPNTPFPPPSMKWHYHKDDGEDGEIHRYYDESDPLSHSAISFVHGASHPAPPHPPNPYPGLPLSATTAEKALYDANGPLWYRGWALEDERKVCKDVDGVLAKTGTRRMIMGHTPNFRNIVSRCNGKVIIIDTGISHAYGGVLSALSIHYSFRPIGDDAKKQWIEKEVVSAIYADRREVLVEEERVVVGDF
ncbi:Metallo-dependent phosphatase-like protein [Cyathus striatus]|nr:Metallo-dependent phosphatase-like protein [Cyathus striatus]